MSYQDFPILNLQEYEAMAKAYSRALKEKGFCIIKVDNQKNQELIFQIFDTLFHIKMLLFRMGGFLGTSKLYSLTDRQTKKLASLLEFSQHPEQKQVKTDKVQSFLSYLAEEFKLIKLLLSLSEQSNYESELSMIISDRLTLLSNTFAPQN